MLITSDSPSAANALEDQAPEGYVYVSVKTGVSNGDYIEVTSGLQEGDTVAHLPFTSNSSAMDVLMGDDSEGGPSGSENGEGGAGGGAPSAGGGSEG